MLHRWPKRVGTEADEKYVEQLFRRNRYTVIEPAKKGRLIVSLKDIVFVISKSNSTLTVHTTYGKLENYTIKRPHAVDDFSQVALDKWSRHQYLYKNRR